MTNDYIEYDQDPAALAAQTDESEQYKKAWRKRVNAYLLRSRQLDRELQSAAEQEQAA